MAGMEKEEEIRATREKKEKKVLSEKEFQTLSANIIIHDWSYLDRDMRQDNMVSN